MVRDLSLLSSSLLSSLTESESELETSGEMIISYIN